jgi:hypothetical protein
MSLPPAARLVAALDARLLMGDELGSGTLGAPPPAAPIPGPGGGRRLLLSHLPGEAGVSPPTPHHHSHQVYTKLTIIYTKFITIYTKYTANLPHRCPRGRAGGRAGRAWLHRGAQPGPGAGPAAGGRVIRTLLSTLCTDSQYCILARLRTESWRTRSWTTTTV